MDFGHRGRFDLVLAYRNTPQADTFRLVAKKLQSSHAVEGELPEDGLAAYGDDLMPALARRYVSPKEVRTRESGCQRRPESRQGTGSTCGDHSYADICSQGEGCWLKAILEVAEGSAKIAKMNLEEVTFNPSVLGSNPRGPTTFHYLTCLRTVAYEPPAEKRTDR